MALDRASDKATSTRLINAVTAAGCEVFEVQFDTELGLIRIITDKEAKPRRQRRILRTNVIASIRSIAFICRTLIGRGAVVFWRVSGGCTKQTSANKQDQWGPEN
jgi:hypothetical protein